MHCTCSLSKHQIKHVNSAFDRDHRERRTIKIDSDSSCNSDSDDLCSSTAISSVKAPSEYSGKENMPSPIWHSARTKLHNQDLGGEASTSNADCSDSQRENLEKINASVSITDYESNPQISSVLPCASSCFGSSLLPQVVPHLAKSGSPDRLGDCHSDSENEFSDKQKEAILKFLNDSSEDELCDIPGCSLIKAKLLTQHLPLSKWEDLVSQGQRHCGGGGGGTL